jgi:hypothetical protein
MNDIRTFIERLRTTPETIQFAEVIALIDSHYSHTPTAFINGAATNQASENQGSAKVFSFARLHDLNEIETLHCFALKPLINFVKHFGGNFHRSLIASRE